MQMKTLILSMFIFLFSLNIFSQQNKTDIQDIKMSFIVKKLDLNTEESQQFFTIYAKYDKTIHEIKNSYLKNIYQEIENDFDSLTDEKANQLLDDISRAELEMYENRKKLSLKLLNVISPKKNAMLKLAEQDFKKKILEKYKSNTAKL